MSALPQPVEAERPLRVLVVHNAYQQAGGEDGVVAAEVALLLRRGHEVIEMRRDNAEIWRIGRAHLAAQTLWSHAAHREAAELVAQHRPDIVHVHNTLPLLSPSVHWAAASSGAAVVQTLHNFRLACPQAMFLRDGKVCEDCLGRVPLPAVVHGCYRGSRAQSAVVASMLVLHRAIGTWRHEVDRFIALSEFSRGKFIEAGLHPERIVVKPNFVEAGRVVERRRADFVFVGRLSQEKGIDVLAQASEGAHAKVRVVGDGPEAHRLAGSPRIARLGRLDADGVRAEMEQAVALVVPSICFENFPRTIVEAYASALPVIASRLGSLAELVIEGETGLLFRAGDAADLARAMRWAEANPEQMAEMGRNARARYEALYTPGVNYVQLMATYRAAFEAMRSRRSVS